MDKIKNLDIKTIIIIVLGLALILSITFRPSKPIEDYETELNALRIENESLSHVNDSLTTVNDSIDAIVDQVLKTVDSTQTVLNNTEVDLKNLQIKRNEVSNYINTLDADGVSVSLSNYLARRSEDNNQ